MRVIKKKKMRVIFCDGGKRGIQAGYCLIQWEGISRVLQVGLIERRFSKNALTHLLVLSLQPHHQHGLGLLLVLLVRE